MSRRTASELNFRAGFTRARLGNNRWPTASVAVKNPCPARCGREKSSPIALLCSQCRDALPVELSRRLLSTPASAVINGRRTENPAFTSIVGEVIETARERIESQRKTQAGK